VHNFPEAVGQMQRAIRNSIERYEPRLRKVQVTPANPEDDFLQLRFEITAELVTADEDASVWFETTIGADGHVRVRG